MYVKGFVRENLICVLFCSLSLHLQIHNGTSLKLVWSRLGEIFMILTLKIGHCKWRVTWNNNDISLISQTIPLDHGFYETLWLALNCNQFIHLLLHTAYLTVLGNKIWAFFFLFLFTMFIKLFSSLMINRTFAKVPGVFRGIKKNWRKKNNRNFFSLCYPPDT